MLRSNGQYALLIEKNFFSSTPDSLLRMLT